jgi:hypothetical protein
MSTVILSAFNVANFPEGGGHFWVYMQYALGLRSLGCEVFWLENIRSRKQGLPESQTLDGFLRRMNTYGFDDRVILYRASVDRPGPDGYDYIGMSKAEAESIFRRADLLLNFHYAIDPALLSRFSRTAFVDIDPGLLQFWVSQGQLTLPQHHLSFTIGETVGTHRSLFPDCGLDWIHIRPPVSLRHWPFALCSDSGAFTTVSSWWGADGKGEFITDGEGLLYENNKRYFFLEFVELPRRTDQVIDLALYLGDGDGEPTPATGAEKNGRMVGVPRAQATELDMFQYTGDAQDRAIMESYGWKVRHSREVAGSPEQYRSHIQQSRGEFSCAKPSCMKFQNAWISDRSICYLASGRPVVLQDTGPSSYLPNGEGMFRFSSTEEAVDALARVNAGYEKHRRAAREIAEAYFDSDRVLAGMLDTAFRGKLSQKAVPGHDTRVSK